MAEPTDRLKRLEARALALLARREYTRAELARRLARDAQAPVRSTAERTADLADAFAPAPESAAAWPDPAALSDALEHLLDALSGQGLLSDSRAADAIVDARRGRRGLLRIAYELEQKGVPDAIANAAMAGLDQQQVPLALEVWRKRFGTLPADNAERARQTRFLASRGFAFEVIRAVLRGHGEDTLDTGAD